MSNFDDELRDAEAAYFAASQAFSAAIATWVRNKTRETYPTATVLTVLGEYNEDGAIRLRAQQVFAGEAVLADVEDPDETFEAFEELLAHYLDWLAEINGEDYLGEHEFETQEAS